MEIRSHSRVSIATLSRMCEFLPAAVQSDVRDLVHTAEFRQLDTLEEQILFLRERTDLSFELLHILMDMKKTTLYRYHRAAVAKRTETTANPPLSQRYGPNSALTIAEEHRLISWIMERQRAQDCPSPRAVREYAAEIRATSRGLQRAPDEHLSRDWWYSFKQRHSDEIGVQIAVSREASWTRITRDTVEAYFAQMREVTANLETPMQLINMDETGFHARLDRNRRRKCVFHKQCQTHVTFCEETSSTTLSLMAAITGNGGMLTPMFVCKENVSFSTYELQTLRDRFCITTAPKGYATQHSMLEWIERVLKPYVHTVASLLQRPDSLIYLIMDNCGVHNTPAVQQKLSEIARLRIIWLPAHTSHFLQMLDASVFGHLKGVYRNLRTLSTRPKIEGKILRAFRALWTVSFPRNILAGFELTGFHYSTSLTGGMKLITDDERCKMLLETNCLEPGNGIAEHD